MKQSTAKMKDTNPHPLTPARVFASRSLASLEEEYGEDRKFIWSVARAMQILQAFRLRDGAMGNNELSESTGIAKATVTRLTHTLTELGYLKRDSSRKYYPSPSLLTLGYTVLGKLRIRQMAQAGMQEIATASKASSSSWLMRSSPLKYKIPNVSTSRSMSIISVEVFSWVTNRRDTERSFLRWYPSSCPAVIIFT